MLNWLKRSTSSGSQSLRETLFGDLPLTQWARADPSEPWRSFAEAATLVERQEYAAAIGRLQAVVAQSNLESRHYLQAWSTLRALGVQPPAGEAKHLYGVVIDMPVSRGTDTLAAYADRSARYLNYSGKAIIWDHPDGSLDGDIEGLLEAGRGLVARVGAWEGVRPELPPNTARISLLTPGGLHFGQAEPSVFFQDQMAQPVLDAASRLMQALIARSSAA